MCRLPPRSRAVTQPELVRVCVCVRLWNTETTEGLDETWCVRGPTQQPRRVRTLPGVPVQDEIICGVTWEGCG